MPGTGWISIRNIPKPENEVTSEQYHQILKEFFQKYKICSTCNGLGFTAKEVSGVTNQAIKFGGIKDLERLHDNGDVNMANLIREIISFKIEGRRPCKTCKGMKYVKRKSS